jgi:hypothetical protein
LNPGQSKFQPTGILGLVYDTWTEEYREDANLVKYVLDMISKMSAMTEVAKEIQLRLVAPHDKQTIDMGDMCPKYLVAWKHTSLTWFLEHH